MTGSTDAAESATNAEPHPSIAHKFPYLQAKTAELAQNTERVGAYIKVRSIPAASSVCSMLTFTLPTAQTYNASSPSPPTTVQTYIGLLTFQSYVPNPTLAVARSNLTDPL